VATNLNVSVEAPGGLERHMTVRVPAAEIEQEIKVRLAKVGRTARLKGFRPGKVPPAVVQQRFGEQVRQEVLSDVIRSSYSQALAQENLTPAGGPRIEPLTDGPDEAHFSYRAVFEVFPQVELVPASRLKIEKPKVEVSAADVEETIKKLREQRADWRTVERKAQQGDRVIVDFLGKIDGEPFAGGEGKEVAIVVGAGQVLEDFDAALAKVKAGEAKSAKVKFPKDYPAEQLAGKKAVFDITVHRVEEQILPELDDAFFESLGVKEGGLEELRKGVRTNLEQELKERIAAVTRRNALASLLAANPIAAPQALIEQEVSNLQGAAMRRAGIKDPAQAPAREGFSELAEQRAKMLLLVRELIREQSMELDRARLDARVGELVANFERPQEAEQFYRANRELMAQLESAVLEDQVVDYLLANASISEKAAALDEFMNR
jgi:trigger factor